MTRVLAIRKNELVIFLIFTCIAIGMFWFSLKTIKENEIDRTKNELIAINEACRASITQWVKYRKENIQHLAKNQFVINKTQALLDLDKKPGSLLSSTNTKELRIFFEPILDDLSDLGVFLIAPDYTSIFSMRDINTGTKNIMAITSKDLLDKVLLNGETVLMPPMVSDVALKNESEKTWRTMFIVTPIYKDDKIIAAFSLRMDIYKDFSRLLELGRIKNTCETTTFDSSFQFLSSSRFNNNQKTIKSIAPDTVIELLKSNQGWTQNQINQNIYLQSEKYTLHETVDYRGEKVYNILNWDKELNMGFSSKIDIDEALEDFFINRKFYIALLILIIILQFIAIFIIVTYRQKSENLLKTMNQGLEVKVAERTEELQQTIATKDKFFRIIAHDLRSPFVSLLGLFELITDKNEDFTEEERTSILQDVFNSSKKLLNLIDNLLSWSRTQTNDIKLNPEKLEIHQLVEEVLDIKKDSAQLKKISLINETESGLFVLADKATVETICRNLISNAIKFSHKNGKVTIKTKNDKNKVTFMVQDEGVGISPENLTNLFRIDQKVSTLGTNNEVGTGLGLLLCKEFVELNKGKITVESELGVGTTFYVELPAFS